jgi:hypothetical protein
MAHHDGVGEAAQDELGHDFVVAAKRFNRLKHVWSLDILESRLVSKTSCCSSLLLHTLTLHVSPVKYTL